MGRIVATRTIPEWTNQLFLERSLPLRGTRVPVNLTPYDLGHVYRFFNPFVPRRCEQKHMIDCGIPSDLAGLLDRANRHDRFLSTLGILPNQLRTILKRLTDHHAEAWLDISKTLFWSGYAIWKRRQILVKKYWREIVPEEWKKNSLQKKKKRKTYDNPSHCTDPFHFFPKCYDFTKQRLTRCKCSRVSIQKRSRNRDIRSFSSIFPRTHVLQQHFRSRNLFSTRTELIRQQHDRGKRKEFQSLDNNI
jgi:hypothetical protein